MELEGSHVPWGCAGHRCSKRTGSHVLPKLTSLDGFRRMSPTPPPFLSPWFSTVTMHMSSVSQARSHCSASASGTPEREMRAKTQSTERADKECRAAG